MPGTFPASLIERVIGLYPEYLQDPLDRDRNGGNAAAFALGPDGAIHGHSFGDDPALRQKVYLIGSRKLLQVWRTGHATGTFEELVYAGKLDETAFGLQRPDLIGWQGGIPLYTPDGALIAAAFSGFRGIKDVEILQRAAALVGLRTSPA
jgi:glc operon protein GlcG